MRTLSPPRPPRAAVTGGVAAALLLLAAGAGAPADAGVRAEAPGRRAAGSVTVPAVCSPVAEPDPPEYYAFPLVPTGRLPGTGGSGGEGRVSFPASSPYGVALEPDGRYRYELHVSTSRLPEPRSGHYVVWVTTPELDRIRPIGPLPESGDLKGTVTWNKFLVVVTLEPEVPETSGDASSSWTGPIVMRGMSRSGRMHTMAGHGPFAQENCAAYGY